MAIEEVAVCDALPESELNRVREVTQAANCSLSLVNNQEVLTNRMPTWVWEMDGLFVATTSMSEPSRFYSVTKRLFDIVSSAMLIALSLPVWAILAIAIKLESKGPIFFRQTRIGQNGQPFEILKFRSMKVDAPKYARSPDEHSDPAHHARGALPAPDQLRRGPAVDQRAEGRHVDGWTAARDAVHHRGIWPAGGDAVDVFRKASPGCGSSAPIAATRFISRWSMTSTTFRTVRF